jgi:VIT1/CCC1 family predicted Fe2+/Mn2+ transporter
MWAFSYSLIGTFIALALLGLLKWRVVGVSLYSALLEVMVVGGVAACLAYYVGTFFAV